jgi:hemerythrin-like domain-containing protein
MGCIMNQGPTDILEAEHRVIEKVVGAAAILADELESGQAVEPATLEAIVEFMRTYADRCHHGKEEAELFPALERKGVPMHGCPIGALTGEHQQGRTLVAGLAEATASYASGNPAGQPALVQGLRGIVNLYPTHIWKEDYLLFPMANKVLDEADQRDLLQRFARVEATMGPDTHQRMEQSAEALAESTRRI